MGELIYYVATSIDGYIADRDGGVDWLPGGEADPDGFGYPEFYNSVDAIVMGRRTYEQVLEFGQWPYPDKPCFVMTGKPLAAGESNVHITDQAPGDLLEQLEKEGHRRTWLVGGATLARAFHDAGLITEYCISIIPHILGGGIPLIPPQATSWACELVDCTTFQAGVVQLRYRRSQDVAPEIPEADNPMGSLLNF